MAEQLQRDVVAKLVAAIKDFIENNPGASLDVQINGTSIVSDGVANIPPAEMNGTYGLIKLGLDGNGISISAATGNLVVSNPSLAQIKNGDSGNRPINAQHQHEAAFYGIATAAGDTTQKNSANAVGSYTDSALDKILQMLGVSALIGPVETATAAHAYSSGDCFLFEGKLVKASANIAVDDTIAIGTNCTQTTLLAEFAST